MRGLHGKTGTAAVLGVLLSSALLVGCTEGPSVSRGAGAGVGAENVTGPGLTRFAIGSRSPAPVVEGPAIESSGTVSSGHPGRVVVVNVWQSTCGPCRAEAAALEKASKQTAADATFVGLDVDDQRASAQAFIRASGTSYDHVYDPDSEQLLKFNGLVPLSAIPSTLVVDRQGQIAARILGAVSADTLTQLVADVASGR